MADGNASASTRRGILALLGTAAVAGCSSLSPDLLGDRPIRLDGTELRSIAKREAPVISETVPVDIERGYLESRATLARRLLSGVPTPFSPREIPNGAIREKLTAMHERANDTLQAAESAGTPYEEMTLLRSARGQAGTLNAAWRAIDEGLTREALLGDAPTVREEVREFDDRWQYVGDDPVRAVLIYERIERGVERALEGASVDAERLEADQENPITVGDLGGDLERARAFLDDVGYLYDRYSGSLVEPVDLRGTMRSASESMVSALGARRRDLPEFDPDDPPASLGRDASDTPAMWALQDLYDHITHSRQIDDARSVGQFANVVLSAQERLARLQAFTALHERVAEGESFVIEEASDVEPIRSAAVRAVETARSDTRYPRLARRVVADLASTIGFADRELADVGDEVEPKWIARDVGLYVTAGATARAVPPATERVASALENAP